MLLLLTLTAAALSGSSVLVCRRPQKTAPQPAKYVLVGMSPLNVVATNSKTTVCEFHHVSSHRVISNLYRMFGTVAVANSDREVAHLYKNTVGNGGYIEFWTHDPTSALQSILARFQNEAEPNKEPVRIHISSKLSGTYELAIGGSTTKYFWNGATRELHKVEGGVRKLAAAVECCGAQDCVVVYRDVVNAYLAICTAIFFTVDAKGTRRLSGQMATTEQNKNDQHIRGRYRQLAL